MSEKNQGWPQEDFDARFKPLIHQMMENRGWLINTYCQVEFLLADLIVKCRKFEGYSDLSKLQLPFGLNNRIQRVRDLAAADPLLKYREQLEALFSGLLEKEEVRHFFAHGYSVINITTDGKEVGLYVKRYLQPKKGEGEKLSDLMVTPAELEEAQVKWSKYGEDANALFKAIYADLGFDDVAEPIDSTNQATTKPQAS
jgi:hypothetical protein